MSFSRTSIRKLFLLIGLLFSVGTLHAEDASVAPVIVFNRGIPGNTSSALVRRFDDDVIALHPDHVVMLVGTNDTVNSRNLVPLDQYQANLTAMFKKLKDAGVGNVYVMSIPPINEEPVAKRHAKHPQIGHINDHVDQFNAALKVLVQSAGANFIDLSDMGQWLKPDGVHFTAEGYNQLAQHVALVMKDHIKSGQRVVCIGDSLTFSHGVDGSGSVFGQAYPAVLNNLLNQFVGALPEARAFAKPRIAPPAGNMIRNGDFTDTDDGLSPYSWRQYRAGKQYIGDVQRSQTSDKQDAYIQLSTPANSAGVLYLYSEQFKLKDVQGKSLKIVLTMASDDAVKNDGQIRVIIVPYDQANHALANVRDFEKSAIWHSTNQPTISIPWQCPTDATRGMLIIQSRGNTLLSDVSLSVD